MNGHGRRAGGVNLIEATGGGAVTTTPFLTEPTTNCGASGSPDNGTPTDPALNCILDNRVNNSPIWDCAAPVAIYCSPYGIDIYRVHPNSKGTLLFRATEEEIEAAGLGGENRLIEQAEDVSLWRLTDGYFQVNAFYSNPWKPYTKAWDACPPTDVKHLEPTTFQ